MEKKRYIAPKTSRALMLGGWALGFLLLLAAWALACTIPPEPLPAPDEPPAAEIVIVTGGAGANAAAQDAKPHAPAEIACCACVALAVAAMAAGGHPGILFLPLPGLPWQPAVVPRPVPCALPALREAALKV